MFVLTKRILPALCLGLLTGTASAAIPDANGVYHGCYNRLTGEVRIVDSGYCSPLEKAVSWNQVGPTGPAGKSVSGRSINVGDANCPNGGVALTLDGTTSYVCNGAPGPQGPVGPQGPQGPQGVGGVSMGYDYLYLGVPDELGEQTSKMSTAKFHATKSGRCIMNYTIFVADGDGTEQAAFEAYPVFDRTGNDPGPNEGTFTYISSRAELMGHGSIQQGAATAAFEFGAGNVVSFGLALKLIEGTVSDTAFSSGTLTWTCQYRDDDPNWAIQRD